VCGFTGVVDLAGTGRVDSPTIERMIRTLDHRGPDDRRSLVSGDVALGFARLSIVDLAGGQQPMTNEDGSVISVCNGEIFNYPELRERLEHKGHVFRSRCDVEVIPHLYEEFGPECTAMLNGQFAFAVYDRKQRMVFCARDQFGIAPLFYTLADGLFIFGSEIKAILAHPAVRRRVDITALDQVFTFPSVLSPRTMFAGIHSLAPGQQLTVAAHGQPRVRTYWDLVYPKTDEPAGAVDEREQIEQLDELVTRSVRRRMQSDVPVGVYLSGGLDSSIIAGKMRALSSAPLHAFSIDFAERDLSEARYQRGMAARIHADHHEYLMDWSHISERLRKVIYHTECPLKETHDTAAFALSEMVARHGIKVVLGGQGADELFAGYIGYRFDQFHALRPPAPPPPAEAALRRAMWGDETFLYEKDHASFRSGLAPLYSQGLREIAAEFDCLNEPIIAHERIRGVDPVHKRSYVDMKLRLAEHLLADHGDRMALASSVEARYPFLDVELVEFVRRLPVDLKIRDFEEKIALKRIAERLVPREIVEREKFGFAAPGSPYLLRQNIDYINDLLSYDRIRREGYFDPDVVSTLKAKYLDPSFHINVPFDTDLLIVVITFGIFLETFDMPALG
jgi:asparagine synthase (glutamine-hydrolysing)